MQWPRHSRSLDLQPESLEEVDYILEEVGSINSSTDISGLDCREQLRFGTFDAHSARYGGTYVER